MTMIKTIIIQLIIVAKSFEEYDDNLYYMYGDRNTRQPVANKMSMKPTSLCE